MTDQTPQSEVNPTFEGIPKRSVKKTVRILLGSGLTVGLLLFLWASRNEFLKILTGLTALQTSGIFFALFGQWFVRASRDQRLYRKLGYDIPFVRVLWINNLQIALNYLPMKAGTLSSAEVFRKTSSVSYIDFTIAMLQQYLLSFAASLGIAALAMASTVHLMPTQRLVGVGLLVTGCMTGLLPLFFASQFTRLPFPFLNPLRQRLERFHFLTQTRPEFLVISALSIFLVLASTCRLLLIYQTEQVQLGFMEASLVSSAMQMSTVISITPAGLGVNEAIAALTTSLISNAAQVGVMVAMLDRAFILLGSLFVIVTGSLIQAIRPSRPSRNSKMGATHADSV